MASFFRKRIAYKVISLLQKREGIEVPTAANLISSRIKVNRDRSQQPELVLPWSRIENISNRANISVCPKNFVKFLRNQGLPTAEGFIDIKLSESPLSLVFTVDKHIFSKIVLMDICTNQDDLARSSCLFEDIQRKNIVVQSSSPAVGEGCHMTHFRTAVHSQFVTNINKFVGHNVINVSHVNDWGIEAASFLTKYRQLASDEKSKNSASHLFQVMKASLMQYRNDMKFKEEAELNFNKMENGDSDLISEWENLKHECMNYYDSVYKKMFVHFDEIHFDSCYYERLKQIQEELLEKDIISKEDGCIKLNSVDEQGKDLNLKNINSDGILFDISRYLNAALEMERKHNFDLMYYVVPSSQKDFLTVLFSIMKKLNFPWADNLHLVNLKSISDFEYKRRKKIDFEDFLEKVKDKIITKLHENLQMELNESLEEMAEHLSISSLIVNDMKHRRRLDYRFNIEDILSFERNTGTSFQLLCAGLKGVSEDSEYIFNTNTDVSALLEPEAHHLIQHLARFDEMVYKSYCYLEPCIIYQYLTSLWYFTDKATATLKLDIKQDKLRVIKARLMLLSATLNILENGLHILGIKPLEKMYAPEKSFVQNN